MCLGRKFASLLVDGLTVLAVLAEFAGEQCVRGWIVRIGLGKLRETLEAFRAFELLGMNEPDRPAPPTRKIRQNLAGGRAPILGADHGCKPQDGIDVVGPQRGKRQVVSPRSPAITTRLEESGVLVEFGRTGGWSGWHGARGCRD